MRSTQYLTPQPIYKESNLMNKATTTRTCLNLLADFTEGQYQELEDAISDYYDSVNDMEVAMIHNLTADYEEVEDDHLSKCREIIMQINPLP